MDYIKDLEDHSLNSLVLQGEKIVLISNLIERYSDIKKSFVKYKLPYKFVDQLNELLNFRLFISFLQADLCCILNSYLVAKTYYQQKYAVRNFIIVVNEGIKKIYGFENTLHSNKKRPKQRESSFWIENLKPIISEKFPDDQLEFDNITKMLDRFLNEDHIELKDYRDLSVHYDKNSLNVTRMLLDIKYEKFEKVILDFLGIINKIGFFCEILCEKFIVDIDSNYELLEKELEIKRSEVLNLLFPKKD